MKTSFKVDENFRLSETGKFGVVALGAGIAGLVLSTMGYFVDSAQFFYSYLTSFVFWTTIALGALFFTMLHHLTSATWSVVVRRFSESAMIALPLLAFFFIPVILGIQDVYHWSHTEAVAQDKILLQKAGYLNTGFFVIRAALYFGIWYLISRKLYRSSLEQDRSGDAALTDRMRRISAPGMALFAATLTFAAFDWMMSVDAHWYSTIFGVYTFGGSFLAALAFMTLMVQYMQRQGILRDAITEEHYQDIGKLLFAFTVFWGYIAFSQYFLIWYANIPEETVWFHNRWIGDWKIFSLLLVFGHFTVPFFVLMPRSSKRNMTIMLVMSFFILAMHWVDLHWIIVPGLHKTGAKLSWMDFTTLVGIGGVFLWYYWRNFTANPLVPVKDPKLQASMQFTNF